MDDHFIPVCLLRAVAAVGNPVSSRSHGQRTEFANANPQPDLDVYGAGTNSGGTMRCTARTVTVALTAVFAVVAGTVVAVTAARADQADPNAAKAATLSAEAAARAHAPSPPKTPSSPPTSTPEPARTGGILNDFHQGPFPASDFRVNNFWSGPVSGRWLLLYAGGPHPRTDGGPVTQGGLRLYTEPIDPNTGNELTEVGQYLLPGARGSVTITATRGTTAILRDEVGHQLTFDLATHRAG